MSRIGVLATSMKCEVSSEAGRRVGNQLLEKKNRNKQIFFVLWNNIFIFGILFL